MGRLSATYAGLFCDEFWTKLDEPVSEASVLFKDIWDRVAKYVDTSKSLASFQIGECMLNTRGDAESVYVPFLCDVRIGFPLRELGDQSLRNFEQSPAVGSSGGPNENKSFVFPTSNSVPQFSLCSLESEQTIVASKNDR